MQSAFLSVKKSILFLCCLLCGGASYAQVNPLLKQGKPHALNATAYTEKLQQQSLLFIENRGQVADADGKPRPEILFTSQNGGAKLYFTVNAIHYQFTKAEHTKGYDSLNGNRNFETFLKDVPEKKAKQSTHRFTVALQGANPHPSVKKEQQSDYFENYYLPQCPNGILGVKGYQKITYENVYPGIDWVIYSNEGFMKYDFLVHVGADRSLIKLKIIDADDVSITRSGELLMKTKLGEVKEKKPVSFDALGKKVSTGFVQNNDGSIGFNVDAEQGIELRIDPSVVWATYYGGSGIDEGRGCTVDGGGNVYMSGYTSAGSGIASGGFQNTFGGGYHDAFLVKFSSGGARLWATYYGGTGDDYGNSCTADASGNVYMAGETGSASGIASGGFQNTHGGGFYDAFLVKFSGGGARQWATYYGGNDREEGYSCAVDGSGNIYMAGNTLSTAAIASGGHQNTFGGGDFDAFLVKFSSTGTRLWATYYGGSGRENGYSCSVDGSSNVYLSGRTKSPII